MFEKPWHCDDQRMNSEVLGGVIEGTLKRHQMLTLWIPHDLLPHGGVLLSGYLAKAEQVYEVVP